MIFHEKNTKVDFFIGKDFYQNKFDVDSEYTIFVGVEMKNIRDMS